jgi:hypothetical protein
MAQTSAEKGAVCNSPISEHSNPEGRVIIYSTHTNPEEVSLLMNKPGIARTPKGCHYYRTYNPAIARTPEG